MDTEITKNFAGRATPIACGRHNMRVATATPALTRTAKHLQSNISQDPSAITLTWLSVPSAYQAKIREENVLLEVSSCAGDECASSYAHARG